MDFEQIRPALINYIKRVNKFASVTEAVVFGSVAEGRATSESDVDMLILSDQFSGLDEDERSRLLYRASAGLPFDLHVYGLTPMEFEHASELTALGALKKQKTILLNVP